MSDHVPPVDESYRRATGAERYRALHGVADDIAAALARRHEVAVERTDTTVRVVPAGDAAAPLSLERTAFPGVVLRAGWWFDESFPRCGCDACDERPDDLVDELRTTVADIVAGRFGEWFDGEWIGYRLATRRTGKQLVNPERRRTLGDRASTEWRAWPPRRP